MRLDLLLLTEDDSFGDDAFYGGIKRLAGSIHKDAVARHGVHLSVALLASAVKARGFTCELLDNFLHTEENSRKLDQLLAGEPLAVGLSTTMLFKEETMRRITERVRAVSPRSVLILGGPSLLQTPEFRSYGDVAVLHEGEWVLPEILEVLKHGGDLSRVPGIDLERNGKRFQTPPPPLMPADEIPCPDWRLVGRRPHELYGIETQRGCAYKCKYCTYPVYSPGKPDTSGLRLKSIPRVIDEIRRNYEEHGIVNCRFIDSTFTFPIRRAEEICRAVIQARLPIEWFCFGRVDNMTPQLAGLMAEAGCKLIFFGVESGDPGVLRNMRRDFTLDDVARGVSVARQAGIATLGSFFTGFPGETEETVMNTERCVMEAGFDFFVAGSFWLDWNAPIWAERLRYSLQGRGGRWRHSTMDSDRAVELSQRLIHNVMIANGPSFGSVWFIQVCLSRGLGYDESIRLMRCTSLLMAHRLALKEKGDLSRFSPPAIEEARRSYEETVLKMAVLDRGRRDHDLPQATPGALHETFSAQANASE